MQGERPRPGIDASSEEVERYVQTLLPYDAYLFGIERCDCKCYRAGWESGYWRGMGVVLAAVMAAVMAVAIIYFAYRSTYIGN
jgi:hypothetical protein